VAGRRRPGAAEQNVRIFGLPGFVADHGPIGFSSGSLACFFPHVRDPSLSLSLSLSFLQQHQNPTLSLSLCFLQQHQKYMCPVVVVVVPFQGF
jgi:hypothetical protein